MRAGYRPGGLGVDIRINIAPALLSGKKTSFLVLYCPFTIHLVPHNLFSGNSLFVQYL
jgi:hypothetical protein